MTPDERRLDEIARLRAEADRFAAEFDAEALTAGNSAPGMEPAPEPAPPSRPVRYDHGHAFQPVPLRFPFWIGDDWITTLTFSQPSFADVEDALQGRITVLELHARMADVPVDVLRALKWEDSERATLIAQALAPEMRRSLS